MGDLNVRAIVSKEDRLRMYKYALNDIDAFNQMWDDQVFNSGAIHVGAEQELCIVDENYNPSKSGLEILQKINDIHYTHELGLYNLEINLDPEKLANSCFSTLEYKLLSLLAKGKNAAKSFDSQIVMSGILPTINPEHLDFDFMTPLPRYKTLSKMLYDIRGGAFEIYLQGVDDFMASLGSVLFEACNTSFQLHLQIHQRDFVDKYNWSQMIAGPVLSACVNSPLLFGHELWSESRIVVFKQSLDTRSSKNHIRKKVPRVYFGDEWLKDSPVNLWKNELIRFPIILTSDTLSDSMEDLAQGENPELRAIRLHNGSTYTWNRLCYGHGKNPHLRIECRYLPAGPSAIDEIANFVFWVGLMNSVPDTWEDDIKNIPFKDVKYNFVQAARTGLNCMVYWFGKYISAKQLILETLLPMAKQGLVNCGVADKDITKYLAVIEKRVSNEQTGAEWMIRNYRIYEEKYKSKTAKKELVAQMIEYQNENIPVHEWEISKDHRQITTDLTGHTTLTVADFMSEYVYTVHEDTSIDLIRNIIEWKNIHHLPVENFKGELVGIITDGILSNIDPEDNNLEYAADIMLKEVISVNKQTSIPELHSLFEQHKIKGFPVTYQEKLIGMITFNDVKDVI